MLSDAGMNLNHSTAQANTATPAPAIPIRLLPHGGMHRNGLKPKGSKDRVFEEGLGSMTDTDLLTLLLGTGLSQRSATEVATSLLQEFGGLEGLCRIGPPALAEHPGLGESRALRIAAALELGRRSSSRPPPRGPLRASSDVARWFTPKIGSLEHEEMWVISLDGRNSIRGTRKVAQGGLHGCSIASRDVLRLGLADAAAAVILVHNHPSGEAMPSQEDIAMTCKVRDAAAIVGVPLLDHVIVTSEGRYSSMLDLKILAAV